MVQQAFSPEHIFGFHAHVYYHNQEQRTVASAIREQVDQLFDVELGRWREQPVGPHPAPMYQIDFKSEDLVRMLPWLMSVRQDLSILVHVKTGKNDVLDHTAGTCWVGPELELNLAFFGDEIGREA